ncbi:MAG: CoA protein activase [Bacteroidetes bacterium]|nr:CoA protein activase [Bacteroidota bacterium]MCL5025168.1 CoA protein activase [Chloroflexota bacterium]
MKIAFPHMGHIWVPLKTLFDKAGVECVVPPPTSRRTLTLGAKYSPEWMCMPYKVNLGNYMEALEAGADTLLGVAGPGLCRLGQYARTHETALRELGYDFEMLTFDWQEAQIVGLVKFIKRLFPNRSWPTVIGDVKFGVTQQLFLLDDLEKLTHKLRPREVRRGAVTKVWRTVPDRICAAHSPGDLNRAKKEILAEFDAVELDREREVLRVGVLGEFFMAIEPFCNLDLEEELGRLGVEVTRGAWLSDWAKIWLFLEALGISHGQKVKKAAAPYLSRDVSGDAVQSVGETVLHSQEGFDGIVHLQPFTCMPEIVAQNLLPKVSREHNIPVLCVILDEQMGKAGLQTRLEAFVDLMRRNRVRRQRARKAS